MLLAYISGLILERAEVRMRLRRSPHAQTLDRRRDGVGRDPTTREFRDRPRAVGRYLEIKGTDVPTVPFPNSPQGLNIFPRLRRGCRDEVRAVTFPQQDGANY